MSDWEEKWKIFNVTFWGPHDSIIKWDVSNFTIEQMWEMRRNNEWVRIIVLKFQRTRSQFVSDIFFTFAMVVPIWRAWQSIGYSNLVLHLSSLKAHLWECGECSATKFFPPTHTSEPAHRLVLIVGDKRSSQS